MGQRVRVRCGRGREGGIRGEGEHFCPWKSWEKEKAESLHRGMGENSQHFVALTA